MNWKHNYIPDIEGLQGGALASLPPKQNRFRAFELCPLDNVRVVILGQDPYFIQGQADGLAFSTWPHVKRTPNSLGRIFKEYERDLGFPKPLTNSLEAWSRNGVLLLNTALTVEEGKPGSHIKLWHRFTTWTLGQLSKKQGLVYMLWGKHAQQYKGRIDAEKNCILCAGHPSPLNRTDPFLGCSHFSKSCDYLQIGREFWKLP